MKVAWRVTRLGKDDFKCDLCGQRGDTFHFVPGISSPDCEVVFACPRHDAGGYWVRLVEWFDKSEFWDKHIAEKYGGREALRKLDERFDRRS